MKIVIIGDSHGNIANIQHVMGFAKNIKAGTIIHTGDWNNLESINTVLEFQIPLYTILGNADVDPEVAKILKLKCKNFSEEFLRIEIGGRKIGVIHNFAHLISNIESLDIVFCGHRHSQDERIVNGVKIVRPGALVSGISFAVYDTTNNSVEFMQI